MLKNGRIAIHTCMVCILQALGMNNPFSEVSVFFQTNTLKFSKKPAIKFCSTLFRLRGTYGSFIVRTHTRTHEREREREREREKERKTNEAAAAATAASVPHSQNAYVSTQKMRTERKCVRATGRKTDFLSLSLFLTHASTQRLPTPRGLWPHTYVRTHCVALPSNNRERKRKKSTSFFFTHTEANFISRFSRYTASQ